MGTTVDWLVSEYIINLCTQDEYDPPTVTTRKPHKCANCGIEIPAGSRVRFYERRGPRYDKNDKQIGIEYWREWMCADYEACMKRAEENYARQLHN